MLHGYRVLLAAGVAAACAAPAGAQDRTFRHTMEFQAGSRFALEAERGSVRLTSWDRPSAEIVARIEPPAGAGADEAQAAVDAVAIEVRGNRRSARVWTNYGGVPRGRFGVRRMPRVHYEIRTPRQVDLDLEIDRAATTIEGFEGRLLLDLDRSDLEARDLAGTVVLQLDRGALRAAGLAGSLAVDLDRTGEVVLDGVRGDLQLRAERASVALSGFAVEGGSAVEIDRGELDIELAAGRGVTVDVAAARRSGVEIDLPGGSQPQRGAFRGDVNGGGPVLRIEADRSAVRVRMEESGGGR